MKDEDYNMRRVGFGLVVISAFVAALVIYAIWTNLP
jgi:hypothetical protein